MKRILVWLGVVFLVIIAGVVVLLVWGQRSGQARQEAFFKAVMSGDPKQITAMFDPALCDEVDEPVLVAWMKAAKDSLGAFKGLAKTDFSTNVKYESGAKLTESSGKVLFEKGEARSELVFRDEKLIKFNIASDRIGADWLKAAAVDPALYRQRGETFLTTFMGAQPKDAFALMHPDLQKEAPQATLQTMADTLAGGYGKIKSVKHEKDEADPSGTALRVLYRVEGEKGKGTADVLFRFVGLKGHILEFHVSRPQ